jgi:hypothetical protein
MKDILAKKEQLYLQISKIFAIFALRKPKTIRQPIFCFRARGLFARCT